MKLISTILDSKTIIFGDNASSSSSSNSSSANSNSTANSTQNETTSSSTYNSSASYNSRYIDEKVTFPDINSNNLIDFNFTFQLFDEDDALIESYDNYTESVSRMYLELNYTDLKEIEYSYY